MKNSHIINTDNTAKESEARALRALLVLELVSSSTQPVTPSQIGMRLQIPKATLARMVDTLVESNHLTRLVGGRGLIPGPAWPNWPYRQSATMLSSELAEQFFAPWFSHLVKRAT